VELIKGYREEFLENSELLELMGGASRHRWSMGVPPTFRRPSLRPLSRFVFDLEVDNLDDFSMVVDRWDDQNYVLHFVVQTALDVHWSTSLAGLARLWLLIYTSSQHAPAHKGAMMGCLLERIQCAQTGL